MGRSDDQQFVFQAGLLYHQGRILIPPTAAALILKILQQYHDSPMAGHYGVARTQALVGQYFKWQGLATAVEAYVSLEKFKRKGKMGVTKWEGVIVGYPMGSVGYRVWEVRGDVREL